jgi:hypothetical protein
MHGFRVFALACITAAASLFGPSIAGAQSFLTVTGCDTVSVNGVTYGRVSFDIHNFSDTVMMQVAIFPISHQAPDDTCHVLQLGSPPEWLGYMNADGGAVWASSSKAADVAPGGTAHGFQAVLSRPLCCYTVQLFGVFVEPFASMNMCMECSLMSPVQPGSWGRLKQAYR